MQQILKTQQIFSIQLHIYTSHLFTFHNTFFIEGFKRYARGVTITVIQHSHPLNQVSELPFAIVNSTHIIPKPKLLSLFEAITAETPIRLIYFKPIYQLCEQLAAVGRVVSEQSKNPYFLLFSPLKKYEIYKWNHLFRKHIFETTQYFNPYTEDLNQDHFIYKVDCLATYVSKMDKNPMIILCISALMKSLRIDKKILFTTAQKNEVLKKCAEDGFILMNQPIPNIGAQPRYIATVAQQNKNNSPQKNKHSQIQFASPKLQLASRLILPLVVGLIFWKVHLYQTVDMKNIGQVK